jgi:peptide deformylase
MALRKIRTKEDEVLRKKSKIVSNIDGRTITLIKDMLDTMYEANGVGLAAPQIGILKRIVVIDVGQGPLVLINPEIIKSSGAVEDLEGCLSIPGEQGTVRRPQYVRVKAQRENGESFEIEGEGMLARAFCHEIDHLDGILYTDKLIKSKKS